jgi:hypothetical protein
MVDCLHCGKPLKLIGAERKNGKILNNKTGCDWKGRQYHKKCYKEKMQFAFILPNFF